MGRMFLEELPDERSEILSCKCIHCDTLLSNVKYIKTLTVESMDGLCSVFSELINYHISEEHCMGQYHKTTSLYMYDNNCVLENMYTKQSNELYCKVCLTHIGWKHADDFIIFQNIFI